MSLTAPALVVAHAFHDSTALGVTVRGLPGSANPDRRSSASWSGRCWRAAWPTRHGSSRAGTRCWSAGRTRWRSLRPLLCSATCFVLVLVEHTVRLRTGRTVAASAVPVLAALVLANDGAAALFSLDFSVTLLSDPLATGADLFGTSSRRVSTGLLSSPAVWAYQLVVVLLGGVVGASVQRDLDRAEGATSRVAPTAVAAVAGVVVALLLAG